MGPKAAPPSFATQEKRLRYQESKEESAELSAIWQT